MSAPHIGMTPGQIATRLLAQQPVYLAATGSGPGPDAELIELALLDHDATVLLDTLIRPQRPIPRHGAAVHGIDQRDTAHAPVFPQLLPALQRLTAGRAVVSYDADHSVGLLARTGERWCIDPALDWAVLFSVQRLYGELRHPGATGHGARRGQPLEDAARECGLQPAGAAHRALTEANLTRRLVAHIASLDGT